PFQLHAFNRLPTGEIAKHGDSIGKPSIVVINLPRACGVFRFIPRLRIIKINSLVLPIEKGKCERGQVGVELGSIGNKLSLIDFGSIPEKLPSQWIKRKYFGRIVRDHNRVADFLEDAIQAITVLASDTLCRTQLVKRDPYILAV